MTKHITATVAFLLGMFVTVPAQQKNAALTPLCDGFYVHLTYWKDIAANGLVAETEKGVILVDTGWDTAQTRQLLDLIAARIRKPVLLCIISHCHADRLGGISLLKARGIRTISTAHTASLAAKGGYELPEGILPPDTMFTVDGLQLVCYYPGPGHGPDNIVVWFPSRKVLFGGCFIKSTDADNLGNIADANLQAWPESIRKVQKRFPAPEYVVPGHDSWTSTNAMEHTLQLLAR
jgi:metallo-beta-lactamase class B